MNTGSHFSVKRSVAAGDKALPAPMQERSRETADLFVKSALRLLREKTFAELSVAELARTAGRSVGVFYQRFGSKDDFLAVLLSAYFAKSLEWRENHWTDGTPSEVFARILRNGYNDVVSHRNLWHAALERSATDPTFWKKHEGFRKRAIGLSRDALETSLGRALTEDEYRRVLIAGQVFNSVINNQIINGPGPLELEDEDFFPEILAVALKAGPFEDLE